MHRRDAGIFLLAAWIFVLVALAPIPSMTTIADLDVVPVAYRWPEVMLIESQCVYFLIGDVGIAVLPSSVKGAGAFPVRPGRACGDYVLPRVPEPRACATMHLVRIEPECLESRRGGVRAVPHTHPPPRPPTRDCCMC